MMLTNLRGGYFLLSSAALHAQEISQVALAYETREEMGLAFFEGVNSC